MNFNIKKYILRLFYLIMGYIFVKLVFFQSFELSYYDLYAIFIFIIISIFRK